MLSFKETCFKKNSLKKKLFSKKLLAACCLVIGVSACSSTDEEEDKSQLVAELTDISQQFKPEILWEKSVGDGVDGYFSRLKPVVAYGKVFSASRDGDVVAFDVESGKEQWKVDLRDVDDNQSFFARKKSALLSGGPIAGIDRVFIGSENGEVFALDANTGELIWQSKVKGEVIAAPAIDAGILVVNTSSGILKAFNASDGTDVWTVEQEVPPLSLRGVSPPVIASGGVLVGSADGSLSVYLLEKGQQGWSTEVGEATGSTELERVIDVDVAPLIFGDKIYAISSKGNLTAVDLRSGRVLWKRQYSSYRQLSIGGNVLYLTDIKGHVYAIDRNTGLERWSQLSLTNRGVTGPVPVGNYVVVGDFEGYLHWLDQNSGEIVSRYLVDSSGIYATPNVSKEILYIQSRDGDLQAIKTP
ncbi:MAG: outer membrane protein assembly factor BamB [Alteromonadaceae bacterium]|nr:outer membrane protein assembly factor BamB [Alteromonadaceae bacterium]